MDSINIAIAGFGTVGTGLTKLILGNNEIIERRIGKKNKNKNYFG